MALSANAHVQMEYIALSFECVLMKSACSFIIIWSDTLSRYVTIKWPLKSWTKINQMREV